MNTDFLIEAFGYLGSLLVLISFLMTSVVKLRIINTIGSFIFTVYAFIIHSYPTALMNLVLVFINLRFLWKMSHMEKVYKVIETDADDELFTYLIDYYRDDIESLFPGSDLNPAIEDKIYVVVNDGKPVGITYGSLKDDTLKIKLDYSIPEFRDFSIGTYLYGKLKEKGLKKAIYIGPSDNHLKYLENQHFIKTDEGYVKQL